MIQKYGGATPDTVPYFRADLEAMLSDRYNHPSIVQWEVFNEVRLGLHAVGGGGCSLAKSLAWLCQPIVVPALC